MIVALIVLLIWNIGLTITLAMLFRLCSVLTKDVERVEEQGHKITHLYVKSTFEEAGSEQLKRHTSKQGAARG